MSPVSDQTQDIWLLIVVYTLNAFLVQIKNLSRIIEMSGLRISANSSICWLYITDSYCFSLTICISIAFLRTACICTCDYSETCLHNSIARSINVNCCEVWNKQALLQFESQNSGKLPNFKSILWAKNNLIRKLLLCFLYSDCTDPACRTISPF